MKLNFNDLLYRISYALDCVEHDLIGATTYHGQRTACICVAMGKGLGLSDDELLDLARCAILHDNALTEYIEAERENGRNMLDGTHEIRMVDHCIMGEKNLAKMPFSTDVKGSILYHHENANGNEGFGKTADEIPMTAQLIHLADQVDVGWDLSYITNRKYEELLEFLEEQRGKMFSDECVDLFEEYCTRDYLFQLNRERALVVLEEVLPPVEREYSQQQIKDICSVFAKIVDYKSEFTRTHSIGIAEKAEVMGRHYHYPEEDVTKLYMAGALHDIGKLVVDRGILEKPDKLTEKEYQHIQNHAYYTYDILRRIHGLEDVTNWASLHHEKLNGKGYPFGKTASELNQKERLMGCLDIYQALTEKRPYKEGMSHEKSIDILRDMAGKGFLDRDIVDDLDLVFG